MLSIQSKMEIFARTYAKDCGVQIVVGSKFCTDGKKITIAPIPDQHDQWVRFMTEVSVYHETGHIKTGDIVQFRKFADAAKRNIFNVVRDVAIEHSMELQYPGMKSKWIEFYQTFNRKTINPRMKEEGSVLKKILDTLILRGREVQLGVDLGLELPVQIQELFDKRLGKFVGPVAAHSTIEDSVKLTEEIYAALKEDEDLKKQERQQRKQQQQQEPQQGDSEESGDSGEEGEAGADAGDIWGDEPDDEQSEPSNSGPEDKPDDSKNESGDDSKDGSDSTSNDSKEGEDDKDEKEAGDSADGNEDDDGTDESGDSSSKKSDRSKSGDADGESDGGSSSDGDGAEEDEAPADSPSDEDAEGSGVEGDDPDDLLSDEAEDALKDLQDAMEKGEEVKSIEEDAVQDVNDYVQTNVIYREAAGLKELIYIPEERFGWEMELASYEEAGRKMLGYLGSKLRNLLISERASIWEKNVRTGRLDTRKLWRVKTGSYDVCKRKSIGIYEDAVIMEVIDNSGSMRGGPYKESNSAGNVAQAILTAMSSDLDKLRVPFGAVGFTIQPQYYTEEGSQGIRTQPAILNMFKSFDEPYRKVRHRFVWPSYCDCTAELPAIKYAAEQLATRRETKKILFILTDGGTGFSDDPLNEAMRVATKEYIERLIKVGIKVVGIGIYATEMAYYCPDFIHINDIDKFAGEFYNKLMKLLL